MGFARQKSESPQGGGSIRSAVPRAMRPTWRVMLPAGIALPIGVSLLLHSGGAAWLWLTPRYASVPATSTPRERTELVLTLTDPPVVPTIPAEPAPLPQEEQPPAPEVPAPEIPAPVVLETAPAPVPRQEPIIREVIEPPPPPPPAPSPALKAPPDEPKAPTIFAGVQAKRALRVVYVIDGSGPMTSSLPFVVGELQRSIDALRLDQSFQVVLFREPVGAAPGGSDACEVFSPSGGGTSGLVHATPEIRRQLGAWLAGIRPQGRSNPEAGLRRALELQPELVFLLSRSIKRSGPSTAPLKATVLADLDRLNPRSAATGLRPVVIKTIQFIEDDPSGLLQSIADSHGDGPGSYRLVRIEDISRPRRERAGAR